MSCVVVLKGSQSHLPSIDMCRLSHDLICEIWLCWYCQQWSSSGL